MLSQGEGLKPNRALCNEVFQERLAFGQIAETDIARWLMIARGNIILPIYDIEYETGKGPRLFSAAGNLVAQPAYVWKEWFGVD